MIQIRGLTYQVKDLGLSPADTLNGFQWKGEVDFNCRVYRRIRLDSQGPQWSDWIDGVPGSHDQMSLLPLYSFTKKNGHWTTRYVAAVDAKWIIKPSEAAIRNQLPR